MLVGRMLEHLGGVADVVLVDNPISANAPPNTVALDNNGIVAAPKKDAHLSGLFLRYSELVQSYAVVGVICSAITDGIQVNIHKIDTSTCFIFVYYILNT